MANKNLTAAKRAKNDEFYTQLSDIEKELIHYKAHFKDKVVYCNCDDADVSKFRTFFVKKFVEYGLKKLICTGYKPSGQAAKFEIYEGNASGNLWPEEEKACTFPLKGDGDFRSAECIEFLKEADIVVTNPPFSLFREYVAQLFEYKKEFLIIGNLNAITYKEIFPLIKDNKMWMGVTYFNGGAAHFIAPIESYDPSKMSNEKNVYIKDGKLYWRVNGVRWFTNLEHNKRHDPIDLYKNYTPEEYSKYDNYDAIEVNKFSNVPLDYGGVMGVPISMVDHYCPEQFEVIGLDRYVEDNPHYGHRFTLNGKETYARILIRKKQ